MRQLEERAAAEVIGVEEVLFLDHEDGTLIPDLNLRREVVRHIRHLRPQDAICIGALPSFTAS